VLRVLCGLISNTEKDYTTEGTKGVFNSTYGWWQDDMEFFVPGSTEDIDWNVKIKFLNDELKSRFEC